VPYLVYGGNQWVGYENALSLYTKASWGYILTSALCSLTYDARKTRLCVDLNQTVATCILFVF